MKKEESSALQGIAALLMVFHHCFMLTPYFADGFLKNPGLTEQFAKSARIAIAICAFVSGYGIYHTLKKTDGYTAEYKNVGRRILGLYTRFWYVLAVTLIAEILFFGREIAFGELPGNITAFNPTYNTTWWYVREYMIMLLIAPLIKSLLQGDKQRRSIVCVLIGIFVIILGVLFAIPNSRQLLPSFFGYIQILLLIVFFEGYFIAFIQDKLSGKNIRRPDNAILMGIIGIVLTVLSYALRFMVSFDGGDSKPDIIITPFFVLGVVLTLRALIPLRTVLAFIGKNLLYIWFIHGLVWKEGMFALITYTNPFIFYLAIFISSLILALILGSIERMIVSLIRKNFQKET